MVDLNCDMGEGFGIYSFADDEEIMPFIDAANVATLAASINGIISSSSAKE